MLARERCKFLGVAAVKTEVPKSYLLSFVFDVLSMGLSA
jgi:hypothetical protein